MKLVSAILAAATADDWVQPKYWDVFHAVQTRSGESWYVNMLCYKIMKNGFMTFILVKNKNFGQEVKFGPKSEIWVKK